MQAFPFPCSAFRQWLPFPDLVFMQKILSPDAIPAILPQK
jgi:hypothetical protein